MRLQILVRFIVKYTKSKISQSNLERSRNVGMLYGKTYLFGGEVQNSNIVLNLSWHFEPFTQTS